MSFVFSLRIINDFEKVKRKSRCIRQLNQWKISYFKSSTPLPTLSWIVCIWLQIQRLEDTLRKQACGLVHNKKQQRQDEEEIRWSQVCKEVRDGLHGYIWRTFRFGRFVFDTQPWRNKKFIVQAFLDFRIALCCLEVGKSSYYIHGRGQQMWYKREICHVRKSKTVLDSGFQAMDSGFQVLDPVFISGTWILFKFQALVGFSNSLSCIPDSKAQDSRFPGFRNPNSTTWGEGKKKLKLGRT